MVRVTPPNVGEGGDYVRDCNRRFGLAPTVSPQLVRQSLDLRLTRGTTPPLGQAWHTGVVTLDENAIRSRLQEDGTLLIWWPVGGVESAEEPMTFPYQPVPGGTITAVVGERDAAMDERNAFATTHYAYRVPAVQVARAKLPRH